MLYERNTQRLVGVTAGLTSVTSALRECEIEIFRLQICRDARNERM